MSKIRVLLVDDHPAILDALEYVLGEQADMEVCGRAGTGAEALRLAASLGPDVVVVDLMLPDVHGLDIVRSIGGGDAGPRSLVYSAHDESVYAERAIRAGASGYVMKSAPTSEVAEAVRTIRRGEVYLSPAMSRRVLRNMTRQGGHDSGFDVDLLTDQEMKVVQLLGDGDTVNEIAEKLRLSRKTVETYRRRARRKLGLTSLTELLRFAIQFGTSEAGGQPARMRQGRIAERA